MKPVFVLFSLLSLVLCSCAIEEPAHEVLMKEGAFELRKYKAIPVVSAPMKQMEQRNDSFRQLFRYISGNNDRRQKVAMTSPVFMDTTAELKGKAGKMSFMIPAEVARAGAPGPTDEGLEVTSMKAGTFAVLRFTGWKDKAKQQAARKRLLKMVAEKELKSTHQPFYAFYDPPWTPELLRRNEVWLRLDVE